MKAWNISCPIDAPFVPHFAYFVSLVRPDTGLHPVTFVPYSSLTLSELRLILVRRFLG